MRVLLIANRNYSSWSLRPWVLMRELGIPFEERCVPFVPPGEPNPFLFFSPSGKVPCLRDGDDVVWDSLAIVEYLAERHPGVWPQDTAARTWARCAAAEMHSGFTALRAVFTMNCGIRVRPDHLSAELLADIDRIDALWQEGLTRFGGPFLAGGKFSAVDAFFAPVAFRFNTYEATLSAAARGWVERMLALPSMQAWYAAALAETWRDEAHEDEAHAVGTWLQDLRRA